MSTAQRPAQARILLHRRDILEKLGIGETALKQWMAAGRFPKPDVYLGRAGCWKPETLDRWVDAGGTGRPR